MGGVDSYSLIRDCFPAAISDFADYMSCHCKKHVFLRVKREAVSGTMIGVIPKQAPRPVELFGHHDPHQRVGHRQCRQ